MKNLILCLALLVNATSFKGQTNVSGFISSNTTWNLSGSPYIVTGNILVSQNVTLTINPGVIVKFNTNKALQIDGNLNAIGTASQRITFTSNQTSPTAGDWAKIHFSGYSVDATFSASGNYISGCIMKHCDVLYAGGLGFGAIDVQQSSPYISKCRILDSDASGLHFNCDIAIVDSSSVKNSANYGIYVATGHYLIQADTISNGLFGGVHMLQVYDGFQSKVIDCYFSGNNTAISYQNNGISWTTISNCTFINNTGPVISPQGNYDTITCNKFINNLNGPAISFGNYGQTGNAGLIYNNLFDGNINSNGPSVIESGSGAQWVGDNMIFANNTVRNNVSADSACCDFYVDFVNNGCTKSLRIYDNIFKNNTGSSVIKMKGNLNSNTQCDFLYMKNNSFKNSNCDYELFNAIPYGAPNLYLDSNYWGGTSIQHIDSVIYDYFDFANHTVVYYLPILTSPISIDTICQEFPDLPTDVNQINAPSQTKFSIYPNPFNLQAVLQTETPLHNATLTIINCLGEIVSEIKNINSRKVILPRNDLTSGIYFVQLVEGSKLIANKKIVITD